jgi:hypothetical protein
MEKIIKSSFSPNDTIYFVDMVSVPYYQKCPTCLGEGNLFRKNGSSVTCLKCKGEGKYTDSGALNHVVKEDVIRKIHITVDEIGVWTESYLLEEKGLFQGTVYETKEEAEKNIPHCVCGYGTT